MQVDALQEAAKWLEKANADLEPELLNAAAVREHLALYARIKNLASFGESALAAKADDAKALARIAGTSIGKAKQTVETAKTFRDADEVRDALKSGTVSFEQAAEVAKAEKACPGSSTELLQVAKDEGFSILKDRARKVVLEAEQHRGLGERQKEARSVRTYSDDLGMINVHLRMVPSLGTAIVNRADAEARRLQRAAKREGRAEPFDRHLADAYGAMLSGAGTKAKPRRPELVVLVSHEVAQRGWTDVRPGEICKIPGVGPVPPQVVRDEVAPDAFLTGLVYDGKELRQIMSWTRNWPVEVRRALNLGKPPDFDGLKCVDCGNRFHIEDDHIEPYLGGENPSAYWNHDPRCWPCHTKKTEADRKAGKLKPPEERGPP